MEDPIIHIISLASELTFSGLDITRLSGKDTFTVVGDTVMGVGSTSMDPRPDSHGTIQIHGSFTSIPFTAFYEEEAPLDVEDGILIQIGTVPEPATSLLALLGLGFLTRRRL